MSISSGCWIRQIVDSWSRINHEKIDSLIASSVSEHEARRQIYFPNMNANKYESLEKAYDKAFGVK